MSDYFAPVPKPRKRIKAPKRLQSKKGINPVNAERKAERFDRDYGAKADWVRDCFACCVTGRDGTEADPIVAAHVQGRGAGGHSESLVPMLASEHDRLHTQGIQTYQREKSIDLYVVADHIEDLWKRFEKD